MTAKKKGKIKTCRAPQCSETFLATRDHQVYCSTRCRIRAFAQLQEEAAERDAKRRQELEDENLQLRRQIADLQSQLAKLK